MQPERAIATPASISTRRLAWFRRCAALFACGLFAATWRLWTPQDVFPQVPLLSMGQGLPSWLEWLCAAVMAAALLTWIITDSSSWVVAASVAFLMAVVAMTVIDQHRLQPWAYQLMLFAVVFATSRSERAIQLLRVLAISIYFFSAVSKFDHEFLHTLGQQFLGVITDLCRIPAAFWSERTRLCLAALFPLGELAISLGLCFARTRRLAAIAAVIMHVLLLVILGPWGLRHQAGVLIWNAFFAAQAVLLFWPRRPVTPAPTTTDHAEANRTSLAWVGTMTIWLAAVLPILECFGRYDHWLAWGLYSPRNSRVLCYIDDDAADQLPASLKQHLQVAPTNLSQLRLRLDIWSLQSLGCPIYPQDRFQAGVVLAIAERYDLGNAITAEHQSAAARWSGQRNVSSHAGRAAIDDLTTQFFLNASPRRTIDNARDG